MAAEDPSVSGVSGRYATALFELARDEKSIDAVKADLDKFEAMLADSADLKRLVRSPVLSADMQLKALSAVLDQAGISGTHWRTIVRGGVSMTSPRGVKTLVRMAEVVGVTAEQMGRAGRSDVADVMRPSGDVYADLDRAIDEHERALQTMRSFVGVMPGERRGCLGCHESHSRTPAGDAAGLALAADPGMAAEDRAQISRRSSEAAQVARMFEMAIPLLQEKKPEVAGIATVPSSPAASRLRPRGISIA